jgi:hypothetical protein
MLATCSFGEPEDEQHYFLEFKVRRLLLYDPRMERVWGAICGRGQITEKQLEELVAEVIHSLQDFHRVPRRTRSEHRANFTDVAKKAKQLSRKISRDLGSRPVDAFEYVELRNFGRFLNLAELSDTGRRAALLAVQNWLAFARRPTYSEVLDNLAIAAQRAAQVEPRLRKPRSQSAKGHYLALRLNAFFRRHLRSPFHEHVATITNVATEIDPELELQPETVRKLSMSRSG